MFRIINRIFISCILCATAMTTLAAEQNTAQQDPYKIVQQTTEQVLAIIKEAKGYYAKDPERFHNQVTTVLDKVVDFDSFSRSIMGSYASERGYQALKTDAEKAVFKERIQRFSSTFKQGLVHTYANGLLNFNGQKIETLPPAKGSDAASGSVSVIQKIYNDSGKPYVIQYSMRRSKDGQWKLHNLIIEGINLGLTYRNQFSSAADLYKGDIEKVIANWSVEPQLDGAKTSAPAATNAKSEPSK